MNLRWHIAWLWSRALLGMLLLSRPWLSLLRAPLKEFIPPLRTHLPAFKLHQSIRCRTSVESPPSQLNPIKQTFNLSKQVPSALYQKSGSLTSPFNSAHHNYSSQLSWQPNRTQKEKNKQNRQRFRTRLSWRMTASRTAGELSAGDSRMVLAVASWAIPLGTIATILIPAVNETAAKGNTCRQSQDR
jgi:hypothetical protein